MVRISSSFPPPSRYVHLVLQRDDVVVALSKYHQPTWSSRIQSGFPF